MAIHVTSWDWQSPTLRNSARDIEPCIKAITLEHVHMQKYRPNLLEDLWIGALCKIMELALSKRIKNLQTIENGKLKTMQEWIWWDNLHLREMHEDPQIIVAKINDKNSIDCEAITKLINYVGGMACAKVSLDSQSLMSSDVLKPLQALVQSYTLATIGLEINSAHIRSHILNHDTEKQFYTSTDVNDLKIVFPDSELDLHTTYDDTDNKLEQQPAPVKHKNPIAEKTSAIVPEDKDAGNGKPHEKSTSAEVVVSTQETTAGDAERPVPRPHQVQHKQCQPSLAPLPDQSNVPDDADSTEHPPSSGVPINSQAHVPVVNSTDSVVDETVVSVDITPGCASESVALETIVSVDDMDDMDTMDGVNPMDFIAGTLPPLTLSPHGNDMEDFSTTDTNWYKPDDETDVEMSEQDDARDETYHPTQGSTQTSDVPVTAPCRSGRHVAAAGKPSAASTSSQAELSTKHAYATTGGSTSSSMAGCGKQQKKKAQTTIPGDHAEDDEDDNPLGSHKGSTWRAQFIAMVPAYIISVYEVKSPLRKYQLMMKSFLMQWNTKNSAKASSPLNLVHLGLTKGCSRHIFKGGVPLADWVLLMDEEYRPFKIAVALFGLEKAMELGTSTGTYMNHPAMTSIASTSIMVLENLQLIWPIKVVYPYKCIVLGLIELHQQNPVLGIAPQLHSITTAQHIIVIHCAGGDLTVTL
ncbi:hypothetical protein DFH29DRAFT_881461 [Suillus ampliporus]|nr:hypothetical protein DFH29DRAFT_881461 [Suillus ampliporus]